MATRLLLSKKRGRIECKLLNGEGCGGQAIVSGNANHVTMVLDHPDIKKKVEMLKSQIEKTRASTPYDINRGLKNREFFNCLSLKLRFSTVLRSLDLDLKISDPNDVVSVEGSLPSNLKSMIGELNEEIQGKFENIVNPSELRAKINLLKLELAKAGKNTDAELQNRIQIHMQNAPNEMCLLTKGSRDIKENSSSTLSHWHTAEDPNDKKVIICDVRLKKIFAGKERVGFLKISGLITPHLL